MTELTVTIKTEYIKLNQLLKLANVAAQGSDASFFIGEGLVSLNGEGVSQRGKKIRPGDVVCVGGDEPCKISVGV